MSLTSYWDKTRFYPILQTNVHATLQTLPLRLWIVLLQQIIYQWIPYLMEITTIYYYNQYSFCFRYNHSFSEATFPMLNSHREQSSSNNFWMTWPTLTIYISSFSAWLVLSNVLVLSSNNSNTKIIDSYTYLHAYSHRQLIVLG